jgi:hypothetical protein
MCITRFQFKVQDSAAQHLPQVQEVQERFDKYRELAAVQLEEAKKKIKSLEHQLDDRIIEADMAKNKAKEEMREREKERLEAIRRESDAVHAAAGENHAAKHKRHSMMNNRQWDRVEASVKSSFYVRIFGPLAYARNGRTCALADCRVVAPQSMRACREPE